MKTETYNMQTEARPRGWIVLFSAALCMLLSFSVMTESVVHAQQPGSQTTIEDAKSRFGDLQRKLNQLLENRKSLEARYNQLTSKIAQHKRQKAGAQIIGGIQLESLLEQARELAEQLNGLQEQVRQVETTIEYSRQEILASYQDEILTLEQQILNAASGEERAVAIKAINDLKRERHAFTARATATPDLALSKLPTMQDTGSEDPEEIQALAAEMDDTERKLRAHISELDSRISRLEQDRRLRQRAREFNEEESFFDETTRSRRLARSGNRFIGATNDPAGAGKASGGGDRSAQAPETTGGGGQSNTASSDDDYQNGAADPTPQGEGPSNLAGSVDEPGTGAPEEGDGLDSDAEMRDDGTPPNTDGGFSDPNSAVDNGGIGSVPEPGVGPTENLPTAVLPNDPFSTQGVVVRSGVDSSPSDDLTGLDKGTSLEGQLKRLKDEKKRFEKKANELKKRSKELKQRARDL